MYPLRLSKKFLNFVFIATGFITICLAGFIVAARCLGSPSVSIQVPNSSLQYSANVSLITEVISADPIARTFVMDWYPSAGSFACFSDPPFVADIYLDSGLLDTSSPSFSVLPPYPPVYRYNLTAICDGEPSLVYAFRTVSKLLATDLVPGAAGPPKATLQNYPFDVYFAPFSLYALEADTGSYIRLNITQSFGGVVNFQVTTMQERIIPYFNGTATAISFNLKVERTIATRAFVVAVGITNWLTASAFLTITAATLIYRSHKIYSEIFVVPVGSLFAFTTIRASFPGAPSGFGATIDLYTILPVLIIMSMCSFFLLLVILYQRIMDIGEGGERTHRKQLAV